MANGLKTATEVISENSKTYKTIRNYQTQIKPAIEHLCENIIALGALYDLEYDGKSIAALANDYELSVTMEDAVLEDSQTRLDRAILLLGNGLISKETVLTDPKYGIGMTEEEAQAEIEKIAKEQRVGAETLDIFAAGTLE